MRFKNFKNYLSERTKHSHGVVSDDKGFANRDYEGELSLKPKPQQRLQPEEYYAPNAQKNPGLMTADGKDRGQPLGDMGSGGLTPKNSSPFGQKPVDKTKKIGGKKKKKLPTQKTMKVESFLNKTKNMNNVQFTRHLLEDVKKVPTPTIRDLYGREFVPEPAQTMKYVAQLMLTNENMMRRMIRELKRNEGFHLLVSEVLTHPETYDCLNEAARGNYGKMIEQKISMFFEGVSPPRATSPGPASAGAPGGGGGKQGGPFGGGSGSMQGPPSSGISGGPDAGGGFNINTGGGMNSMGGGAGAMQNMGVGGMQGMGEEEMNHQMPGGMSDMGGMPDMDDNDMDDNDMDNDMDDDMDDDDDDMDDDDMDDDDMDDDDMDDDDMDDDDMDDDDDDDDDDENMDDDSDDNFNPGNMGGGMNNPMGGGMNNPMGGGMNM